MGDSSSSLVLFLLLPVLPVIIIFFSIQLLRAASCDNSGSTTTSDVQRGKLFPKCYPLIGSSLAAYKNKGNRVHWTSEILRNSPSATFLLRLSLGRRNIMTANPSNVRHILKSRFDIYHKGSVFCNTLRDFLGDGIFNVDGDTWKFQRQVSSHEFNTRSLRKFILTVVDAELSDRLIPILSDAAEKSTVLDFQDILQRFAFDNVCQIAFGHDPSSLLPSLPRERFAEAFEDATRFSSARFSAVFPIVWRLKKLLNIGSEKQLRMAIEVVREFAGQVVRSKKKEKEEESVDMLSRFLISGHSDEKFLMDIVISFVLAGRDTTSAALTWFCWLLSRNPGVEERIFDEVERSSEVLDYEEVKEMVYTHAALCETMRLYPPVPADSKEAMADDVLPTGMKVRKGTRVTYHPYAMGRVEALWGKDWPEFRPERWLQEDPATGKRIFVPRDVYEYPVFQAGPRICLGKDMALLQMKRVVAAVLPRFKIVPAVGTFEPVFVSHLTAKMRGGFAVKIRHRAT